MKAFIREKYGPPETLRMAEAEKPAPTALVKVFGISVNPADWHSMRCKPLFSRATLGLLRLKYRIVVDIAGLVKAVGGSVTRFERGDGCPGAHQRRILDTAYGKRLDLPLRYAQLIVALDYPRWFSLQRLVRRTVTRLFDRRLICNGNRESLRVLFSRDASSGGTLDRSTAEGSGSVGGATIQPRHASYASRRFRHGVEHLTERQQAKRLMIKN